MNDYWTIRTGEEIAIKNMTTSHIKNCMRFLERNEYGLLRVVGDVSYGYDPFADLEFLPMDEEYKRMRNELIKREQRINDNE